MVISRHCCQRRWRPHNLKCGLWKLFISSQTLCDLLDHTRLHCLNLPRVPATGNQIFKCLRLWRVTHSKYYSTHLSLLNTSQNVGMTRDNICQQLCSSWDIISSYLMSRWPGESRGKYVQCFYVKGERKIAW